MGTCSQTGEWPRHPACGNAKRIKREREGGSHIGAGRKGKQDRARQGTTRQDKGKTGQRRHKTTHMGYRRLCSRPPRTGGQGLTILHRRRRRRRRRWRWRVSFSLWHLATGCVSLVAVSALAISARPRRALGVGTGGRRRSTCTFVPHLCTRYDTTRGGGKPRQTRRGERERTSRAEERHGDDVDWVLALLKTSGSRGRALAQPERPSHSHENTRNYTSKSKRGQP